MIPNRSIRVAAQAAALLAAAVVVAPAAAADVGISIGISQPGVYGRIDIGRFPPPVLVAPQPVIVVPPRVVVAQPQPVYLWVPPGHRKNWRKHCHQYGACGAPVYFVKDDWYHQHVHRGPGRVHGHGHGKGHGDDKGHGKGHGGDKGHGKGHGHGKDRD